MQNELIKINNSLTLNEKPSEEIVSKLPTQNDLVILKALESDPISKCSRIEVKEVLKTCLQLSGCQTPPIQDFDFIVDFVIENYGNFRLQELKAAYNLLATNRLEVEKHIVFNPRQVGDVMSSYKKIATETRKLIPPKETTKVYQVDEEQSILEEQTWWQTTKKKDWRMLNHQVYDYLWKRKVLNKENVTPIAHEIRQKVTNYLRNKAENDTQLAAIKDEEFIRTQCKKYTLALYFDNKLKAS